MGKKPRPKSKQEKLDDRRKHFLDEQEPKEMFLDEGGSQSSDDEMPEEVPTKKTAYDEEFEEHQKTKTVAQKKKRRRIKKEDAGVYTVETKDLKVKVVAQKNVVPSRLIEPTVNFKELLLQESTKSGRRKAGASNNLSAQRWLRVCPDANTGI